jgi:hypothetical protein
LIIPILEAVWDDIEFVSEGAFKTELGEKYFPIDEECKFIQ